MFEILDIVYTTFKGDLIWCIVTMQLPSYTRIDKLKIELHTGLLPGEMENVVALELSE